MASLDSVPGAGFLVTEDFTITRGNHRCEVVFKEDFDEIRDASLRELEERGLLDGPDRRRWEQAVRTVLTNDTGATTEEITLRPAGTPEKFVYDLKISPAESSTSEVCCSLRSVGTSRRYEETVTALHVATRELMTAEDIEEVLRWTAEAANDVLGFPGTGVRRYDGSDRTLRHVAFGARLEDIDDRPTYHVDDSPQGRAFRTGQTIIEDIESDEDPYDREVFTQTMYIPIGSSGVLSIGVVGSRFDETDVQFAEILAENAAAAIRVVETTTRLRTERERLDRFASVVSHDLRNPLAIARGYLDRARETGEQEHFDSVEDALDRMDQMIAEMLTLARADGAIDDTQAVELSRLVADAWETTQTGGATIALDPGDDRTLECDPSLTQSLFENLFHNAVDHNDPPVTVRVGLLDSSEGFFVEDDGSGIPESKRESVSEYGYTSSDGGTGFGLSIVSEVVSAHGWALTITEGVDGGARFEVRTE